MHTGINNTAVRTFCFPGYTNQECTSLSINHSRIGFWMWLETQPCLTYESVQSHKLFVLCFAKVEPFVKLTDCIYYTYCYILFDIFIYMEQIICIFVKPKKMYVNKIPIYERYGIFSFFFILWSCTIKLNFETFKLAAAQGC